MKYKLFVFDWDGTLMDSEARIVSCMQAAIAELKLPDRSNTQIRNIIGLGLKESVDMLYPGIPNLVDKLANHYRKHFLHINKIPTPLFDGAENLLQILLQGENYLAVATGKGRAGLDKVLDETGLKGYFHYTRCADEAYSKPHPQMLYDVFDYTGVSPDETIMIGDTEYDLQMATNAGCDAIAMTHGVHETVRLAKFNPIESFTNLHELTRWFTAQSQPDNLNDFKEQIND